MSVGPKPVHIVSTDFDYASQPDFDRIGYVFEEENLAASKIYILTNTNPKGITEETDEEENLEQKARKGIINKLEEVTACDREDDIKVIHVDYYDFEEALVTVYDIIYREQQNENNVFVNISGGTKPLAIAMSFASALGGIENPPFYVVKEYKITDENGIHTPDIDEVTQPNLFNLQGIVPSQQQKRNLLLFLMESERDSIGITDALVESEVIAPSPSEGRDDRQNIIQSYNRRAQQLLEDNLVGKENSEYHLTSTGKLAAKIIEVENDSDHTRE